MIAGSVTRVTPWAYDGLQRRPTQHPQRRLAIGRLNTGAHARQRVDHAAHRATTQTLVANQRGRKRLARKQPGQQPHAGAGIAAVQIGRRRLQTIDANAGNAQLVFMRALDAYAHLAEYRAGRQSIGASQKAAYRRNTVGQRAKHDGAMRD